MIPRSRVVLGVLVVTSLVVSGCARGCTSSRPPIHLNPSMDDQPKVRPQTASNFFYNGSSMREPVPRSEEHTSELQSLAYLVCRLLLEKKKTNKNPKISHKANK